ncbi:MAG: SMP-30/gluconolactonase/LRE family protein [Candidatus Eiseniibacteriota bacterium]
MNLRRTAVLGLALSALGTATALAQTNVPTFQFGWGRAGGTDGTFAAGPGEFFDPEHVAADAAGNIWVADVLNHRVQKFTAGGDYLMEIGSFGTGAGQFNSPRGIAVDPGGDVYVVDSLNHRVQRFAADGSFVSQWGSFGAGAGQFDFPRGIALDAAGNAYVTDMNNHRVQKFTVAGTFVLQWGVFGTQNGAFQYPRGICVDPVNGGVFVADSFNHRIQKFTQAGQFVSKFGKAGGDGTFGNLPGEFNTPRDVTVRADSAWVADTGNDRLQRFVNGAFNTATIGFLGVLPGGVNTPRGVCLSRGALYIADSGNHRIDVFAVTHPLTVGAAFAGPAEAPADEDALRRSAAAGYPMEVELLPLGEDPAELTAVVRYQLPAAADVVLEVEGEDGSALATIARGFQEAGVHEARWPVPLGGAARAVRLETGGASTSRTMAVRP